MRVVVDGAERGTTPLSPLEVAAGEHEVSLRAEGYAAFTTRLTGRRGSAGQTLRATLRPGSRACLLFVGVPPGFGSRGRQRRGDDPVRGRPESGARVVEIALAGHRPGTETITVEAEHPLAVAPVRLEPLPGRLQITSEPPAATVASTGSFAARRRSSLDVAAGVTHTVRATRAGHEAAEAKVTLDAARAPALPRPRSRRSARSRWRRSLPMPR